MTEEKTSKDWRRIGRLTTGGTVGSIAAIASFDHQRSLAMSHGQNAFIGTLLPVSVDVLILCATFAMDGRNRFWPRAAFWAGVGATISANVLAAPPDLLSQLISAWAPVALLFVIEIEARRNKTQRWRLRKDPAPVVAAEQAETETAGTAAEDEPPKARTKNRAGLATAKKVAEVRKRNPAATATEIAARIGKSESAVRHVLRAEKAAEMDAELEAITEAPAEVSA
jgi:hypothetical protein